MKWRRNGLGESQKGVEGRNWENRREGKVQKGCKIINKNQFKKNEAMNLKEIKWVPERVLR